MNYLQKEEFVKFVEKNYCTLFETASDDPIQVRLWIQITQILNALGPEKNMQGWKRCFTCLKSTAKTKLFKINVKGLTNVRLSEIEKKIIKICKLDQSNRLQPFAVSEICDSDSNSRLAPSTNAKIIPGNEQSQVDQSKLLNTSYTESEVDLINECSTMTDADDIGVTPIAAQDIGTFPNHGGSQFVPQSHNIHSHENSDFNLLNEPHHSGGDSEVEMAEFITNQHLPEGVNESTNPMEVSQLPKIKPSKSNSEQREMLANLVAENYSALFGRASNRLYADLLKTKIWTLITRRLNSIGKPKDVAGWKRCLTGLKDATKKKKTAIRQGKARLLTPLEMKIDKTFTTLDGSKELHEIGLKQVKSVSALSNSNLPHQKRGVTATVTSNQMALPFHNSSLENTSNQVESQQVDSRQVRSQLQSSSNLNDLMQQRGRVTATITSSDNAFSLLSSILEPTSIRVESQNEIQPSVLLPELGTQTLPADNMTEVSTEQHFQREGVPAITSNQNTVPPIANPLQEQGDNLNSDTEEIRPLGEETPQRRGVEINLNRYILPHNQVDSDDLNVPPRGRAARRGSDPRRVRLSVPLGVMAAQSLELQRRGNALLAQLLVEFRNANAANRG